MVQLMTPSRRPAPDWAGSAVFSPCLTWRYLLTRTWLGEGITVNFIGANPSTADADVSDPTVRRMEGFARSHGAARLLVTNVFGFRSTDPRGLQLTDDPVGPETDHYLLESARAADITVATWGLIGLQFERARHVLRLLEGIPLQCLGHTAIGAPRHPLYVRGDTALTPYGLAR